MTVARRIRRRGEREISRKTIARGMPGDFRCDRGDYARVLCFISHARLRVHRAPGIPHALCSEGGNKWIPRAKKSCGENAKLCALPTPPPPRALARGGEGSGVGGLSVCS